jgi:hypothetical protein
MTQGFYEQLGARADADIDEIKAAYGRALAHVLRRREATVGQGGDTASLDLARAQLDEAWEVLADPARRRRYDAMLAIAGDGIEEDQAGDLWSRVAGAMIHPSVAAAARLVDACTNLKLAPLPEPPKVTVARHGGATWTEEVTVASSVPSGFGAPRRVQRPATAPRTGGGETMVTPPASVEVPASTSASVSVVDLAQLQKEFGPTGALLEAARRRRGLTLQQMSETTRISTRLLEAVEKEDFDTLPSAAAFVRGYVREMARILGLDDELVVTGYMRRFSGDV